MELIMVAAFLIYAFLSAVLLLAVCIRSGQISRRNPKP